jgi:hypothetical protein
MRKETRFDLELHGLNISLHLEPVFLSMHPAIFSGNFRTEKGNHYLSLGYLVSSLSIFGVPTRRNIFSAGYCEGHQTCGRHS